VPRRSGKVPSYCLHRASGRAVVRLEGSDHYLGLYGSPKSRELYSRLIASWQSKSGSVEIRRRQGASELTVAGLILAWDDHARATYVKNGVRTNEYDEFRRALSFVTDLYGHMLADSFGPLGLRDVRESIVRSGAA
jgi:hypothetical protein